MSFMKGLMTVEVIKKDVVEYYSFLTHTQHTHKRKRGKKKQRERFHS